MIEECLSWKHLDWSDPHSVKCLVYVFEWLFAIHPKYCFYSKEAITHERVLEEQLQKPLVIIYYKVISLSCFCANLIIQRCILFELDNDTEKQNKVMNMKEEIQKYFACSTFLAFKPNVVCKRPCLSIIRNFYGNKITIL